jgi:hypothetical protein
MFLRFATSTSENNRTVLDIRKEIVESSAPFILRGIIKA